MGGAPVNEHYAVRLYIAAAALAGSITSLSFMRYKTMSWGEIGLTVFVGFSFAVFAVPWMAADMLGADVDSTRTICGFTYLGATGANTLIPLAIRRLKKLTGLEGEEA